MAKKSISSRREGAYRIKSAETRATPAKSNGRPFVSKPTNGDRQIAARLRDSRS